MTKMNCKFTNHGIVNVLMFAAGAVIGSAVTWKILNTKYEQMIQEEIESVKEAFAGISEHTEQAMDETEEPEDEEDEHPHHIDWSELEDLEEDEEYEPGEDDLEEYARLTNQYSNEEGGAEKVETKKPYVIDPFDFGEKDGYRQFSLTYYADGVLEDEDHKIVDDVDELIGLDSLSTFGRYEDDSVFVRNDNLRADFEILKDYRKYSEVYPDSPNRVENE